MLPFQLASGARSSWGEDLPSLSLSESPAPAAGTVPLHHHPHQIPPPIEADGWHVQVTWQADNNTQACYVALTREILLCPQQKNQYLCQLLLDFYCIFYTRSFSYTVHVYLQYYIVNDSRNSFSSVFCFAANQYILVICSVKRNKSGRGLYQT